MALEEKVTSSYQEAALAEVRTEHEQYFTALEKHPRLLVGQQVPAIGKEGMETIQSTEDAREWQDAVKSLLVEEVKERALTQLEENSGYLATLHSSIEIFQKNPDMIPGTKGFDVDLANRFATMLKPYELRGEDKKLNGYSIPVQPIIENLRTQIQAERTASPVAAAPSATPAAKAKPAAAPAEPPQAGLSSKAGNSGEGAEDYSTLWGTLGLPNIQL